MLNARKLVLPFIVFASLRLLSGCWSSVELNRRAFTRLILVDKTDQGIELTLAFPLPNRLAAGKPGGGGGGESGGESSKPFTYVSNTGRDISEAYRKIQSDLSRKITFGQVRSVLIGSAFAQSGVQPVVDFLARESSLHINANLFVTEGSVKQFTTFPVTFERFPTDIIMAYAKRHTTVTLTIKNMLMAIYEGGDMLMPMLMFGGKGAVSEKMASNWMSTGKAAIFRHGKMTSTLDTKETRGALWILGQLSDTVFTVPSPTDRKEVGVLIRNVKTKVKPSMNGDRASLLIQSSAIGAVLSSESDLDVSDPVQLNLLEQSLESKLKSQMARTIAKSKSEHADVFQLGNYVKWRYPHAWSRMKADWRERYASKVEVNPNVNITLKWFNAAQKPEWNRILSNKEAGQ